MTTMCQGGTRGFRTRGSKCSNYLYKSCDIGSVSSITAATAMLLLSVEVGDGSHYCTLDGWFFHTPGACTVPQQHLHRAADPPKWDQRCPLMQRCPAIWPDSSALPCPQALLSKTDRHCSEVSKAACLATSQPWMATCHTHRLVPGWSPCLPGPQIPPN
jgi:hypothetical protein